MTFKTRLVWLLLTPPDRRLYPLLLALVQVGKLAIILTDPNTAGFKYWFYRCFQYQPYSFSCWNTEWSIPFPMPYSLVWYAVYSPLTSLGYWSFNSVMLVVDTLFAIVILRHHSLLYGFYWTQFSLYFLIVSPQDYLIWLFILLGREHPFFLGVAPLLKFPLLPPIIPGALPPGVSPQANDVWNFMFNNPFSIRDSLNWIRYGLMGAAWTSSGTLWLKDNRFQWYQRIFAPLRRYRLIP